MSWKFNIFTGNFDEVGSGSGGAVDSVNGQTGAVVLDAADIPYDNISSGLTATDVQAAIDELVTSLSSAGKLLYVDKNRVDSYTEDGTADRPYKTIQGAIDAASAVGDGLSVPYSFVMLSGTYAENVEINNKQLFSVTLVGLGRVAINPAAGNALTSNSNNSDLQDLVVDNIEFGKPIVLVGTSTANNFKTTEFRRCAFSSAATFNATTLNNLAFSVIYAESAFNLTNVNFTFAQAGQIQGTFTLTFDDTQTAPAQGLVGGINILSMMMNLVSLNTVGTVTLNFVPHSSRIGTTAGAITIPTNCNVIAYNSTLRGNWTNNGALTLRNSHSENAIAGTAPTIVANRGDQISNTPAGDIVATNVQAAINELDAEKANISLSNLGTTSINSDLLPNLNLTRILGSESLQFLRNFSGMTVADSHADSGTLTGDLTSGSDLVSNVSGTQTFFSFASFVSGTGIPANTLAIRQSANTFRLVNTSLSPVNATATNTGVTISWTSLPYGTFLTSIAKPTTGASAATYVLSGRTVDNQSGGVTVSSGASFRASGIASGALSLNTGVSGNEAGSATSGAISVASGRSYSSGATGSVTVGSGLALGTGGSGTFGAGTGNTTTGNSGSSTITTGTTTTGNSGQTTIQTGNSSSGGTTGGIVIQTGTTSGTRGGVSVTGDQIGLTATGSNGNINLAPSGTGNIIANNSKIVLVADATDPTDALNLQTADSLYQPILDGTLGNNSLVITDNTGLVIGAPDWSVNAENGLSFSSIKEPDNINATVSIQNRAIFIEPLQNSPDESYILQNVSVNFDNNNSGFEQGTNGTAATLLNLYAQHQGSGNIGQISLINNNFNLGNGTDPIEINGVSYSLGFGSINANVDVVGPIQGYGFQPNVNASATLDSTVYVSAFYDSASISTPVGPYTSFTSSPNLDEIRPNSSFSALNINPDIQTFDGNASFIGIGVYGQLDTFNENGFYHGVSIAPTITSNRYAAGINVNMDNVTDYPGAAAQVVIQDLTIAADLVGTTGNSVTIEYVGGGTAGAEVVSNSGLAFEVQIEDGVSTAQNIADALNAYVPFTQNLNVTISGTASNTQTIEGPLNLSGGENAGTTLAAYLDGDVQITGGLTFGGALSIGKLNAYATQAIVSGSGNPATIHGLVSNPTIGDNETITLGDTIGVNTAMLLTVGDNSTLTSGLVGLSALALPAVLTIGSGSTIDQVAGATFAVSLTGLAGAGTVSQMDLCRSVALPDGNTTVTRMVGFKFDLPFGDPGTTTWGIYESPGAHNYFQGDLLIGGTAGSDDIVTNSSVGLELKSTTKAFLNARMSTTERNALTPINGMQIYNVTDDKLQVYAGGSWVDLH